MSHARDIHGEGARGDEGSAATKPESSADLPAGYTASITATAGVTACQTAGALATHQERAPLLAVFGV